ncbi:hypothetical protein [Spirosoma spitsbergense]|uniref:hypothetical protein n=1 Tax=Spirosoma spitsbergense TaxID=431554 RepID=UPI0003629A68|nr:hypothetical protein [Spirosoma spitsbergense]
MNSLPAATVPTPIAITATIPISVTIAIPVAIIPIRTDNDRRPYEYGWWSNDNPWRNNNDWWLRRVGLTILVVSTAVSSIWITISIVRIRITIPVIVSIWVIWIWVRLAIAIIIWIRLIVATVPIWVAVSGAVLAETNGSNPNYQSY